MLVEGGLRNQKWPLLLNPGGTRASLGGSLSSSQKDSGLPAVNTARAGDFHKLLFMAAAFGRDTSGRDRYVGSWPLSVWAGEKRLLE